MSSPSQDVAGVIAPPPLIFVGGLALGLLLQRRKPVAPLPRAANRPIGLGLIGLGVLIGGSGFRALRRAGTEVRPNRPTTAIVADGAYRFSRNPLYLSMALFYCGITALANALWPLPLLPAVLTIVQRGVIEREERYLERKFGDDYRRYRDRVRRWV